MTEKPTALPRYRVYGTCVGKPKDDDWFLLLETTDAVEAVAEVHETDGTFWRRLVEDGQIVLDRV